jgi:hypothetical protein
VIYVVSQKDTTTVAVVQGTPTKEKKPEAIKAMLVLMADTV